MDTKRYSMHFHDNTQTIVVDDADGNVLIRQGLPTTIRPFPGRKAIMEIPENAKFWQEMVDFVNLHNIGASEIESKSREASKAWDKLHRR